MSVKATHNTKAAINLREGRPGSRAAQHAITWERVSKLSVSWPDSATNTPTPNRLVSGYPLYPWHCSAETQINSHYIIYKLREKHNNRDNVAQIIKEYHQHARDRYKFISVDYLCQYNRVKIHHT